MAESGLIRAGGVTRAGPGLIDRYLSELRSAMRRVSDPDDAIAEVEDHLREATVHLLAGGLEPAEAERLALDRFGSAPLVARAFASRTKGVTMPTQFTRRAGLAGAASVVLVVIGAVIFTLTRMSSLNDDTASSIRAYTFVPFSLVGAALFAVFLVGLRRRNGDRFGALGKTAYVVILAAPVLSLAFLWLAPIALVAILSFGFALLAVALYRAAVLPRRAIVVFGIAVPLGMFIALSGILTDALNADVETGSFAPLGLAPFAVGLLWMGWTMWLEPGPQQIIGPGMVGVP